MFLRVRLTRGFDPERDVVEPVTLGVLGPERLSALVSISYLSVYFLIVAVIVVSLGTVRPAAGL